jgi:hypothetical protein
MFPIHDPIQSMQAYDCHFSMSATYLISPLPPTIP